MPSRYGFGSPEAVRWPIARSASASASAARPPRVRISVRVQCRTPSAKRFARRERLRERDPALDLGVGGREVALLHPQVGEVVARERLLPSLAGLHGERERRVEPLRPVRDPEVAEGDAAHPAREDAQRRVARAVGELDRPLGVAQRGGVGAGEEVEVRLERGELRAGAVVVAGLALGVGGERERPAQVAAVERDHALERERPGLERAVAVGAGALVDLDRDRQRRERILPVGRARGIERARRRGMDRRRDWHGPPRQSRVRGGST